GDHMVARLRVGHVLADGFDDACGLVAQHDRKGARVLALHEMQIAVAQPGRHRAHEHLAWAGGVDLDLVDLELARALTQNGCAHCRPPSRWGPDPPTYGFGVPDVPDVTLLEGMATARAVRRFRTDPIPDDDLASMLWHATRAPSGSNRQPTRFLVLRD